jgi:hypothetical protein
VTTGLWALRGLWGALAWACGWAGVVVLAMATVMPWVEEDFRDLPIVGLVYLCFLALVAEGLGAALFVASRVVDRDGAGRIVGLLMSAALLMVCNPLVGVVGLVVLLSPPTEEAPVPEPWPEADAAAQWVPVALGASAAPILGMALLALPAGFALGFAEPKFAAHPMGPAFSGAMMGVTECALFLGPGLLLVRAAWRARTPSPESWATGIGAAVALMLTGCFAPVGLFVAYALGRGVGRNAHGLA